MELSDFIIAVLIGIGIGFSMLCLYIWVLYQRIRGRVDQMIKEVIEEAEANMVGLDIELDKDTYFCYNNEDKQFICQGKTVAEIKQAFHARYPTKTAYLAGGDPEVVEHFKTELLKLAVDESKPNV
jgi:hypothetical protein